MAPSFIGQADRLASEQEYLAARGEWSGLLGAEIEFLMTNCVLTINGGSSSVKFALFGLTEPPHRMLSGEVERIGLPGTVLSAKGADGRATKNEPFDAPDLEQAGGRLIDWLGKHTQLGAVAAVGHRIDVVPDEPARAAFERNLPLRVRFGTFTFKVARSVCARYHRRRASFFPRKSF